MVPSFASFPVWGGTAVVGVTDADSLAAAQAAVKDVLDAVDLACSRFRDDSEIATLTRAQGQPVPVGQVLFDAVAAGLRAARITDGDVDPTLGHVLRALGYDRDFDELAARGPARVRVVVTPGWQAVTLDAARRTIQVPAGVELDLGATAKALAADRSAEAVHAVTGVGALVSLGGDIALAGEPPPDGWRVRVTDDHRAGTEAPGTVDHPARRRPGHVEHERAPLADRRRRGAPPHRPVHRAPRDRGVAYGQRVRRQLSGREYRQHRGDHPRRGQSWLAGRPAPAQPPGEPRRAASCTSPAGRQEGDDLPAMDSRRRRDSHDRGRLMSVAAVRGPTAYWYLARGTGVVSLLLLTASVVIGILNSERYAAPRWPRFAVDRIHRDVSLLVLAVLVVHIVTSVLDSFAPITLLDGVVPFLSAYRPVWLGLGALAFDVLLAVAITSVLRRRIGFRAWRVVHWAAYASWPVAVVHGLGTGTDAVSSWSLAVTVLCTAATLGAIVVRVLRAATEPGSGRGLWLAMVAATPLALAVFTIIGPLAPHWARRAGTPVSVLHKAHPAVTVAVAPVSSAPAGTAAKDSIPTSFHAQLSGTVAQTQQPGGALVDLILQARGPIHGEMRVRMAGAPLASGGLSMTGSQVQLTAVGLHSVLVGQISSLQGTQFAARVRNSTGTSLTLHASLNIDNSNNTVTGTLNASPS